MDTTSEGDAWMGLKCPRGEKAPIGSAVGKSFRVRVERRGKAVLTARPNPPNLCSKTGQMAISYSLVCLLYINYHRHNDTPFSSSASFR